MSICGLILLIVIEASSLGFAHDPVVDNVISLKLGAKKGFRGHLILMVEGGENLVDSGKYVRDPEGWVWHRVYGESFWRPYSRINFGVRAEYYFTRKVWYQPYIGAGIEGKRESRWIAEYEYPEDTIQIVTPKLREPFSLAPTVVIGIDFYPLSLISQLLKFEIPFGDAISFNVGICGFHFVRHEFDYWRKFSGIESEAGIHFNW